MARQLNRRVRGKDGKPRRSDDIRKAVKALMEDKPLLTGKQMAEELGLSQNTVSKYVRNAGELRDKCIEARKRERKKHDDMLETKILDLWNRESSGGSFWSTADICAEMELHYGISSSKTCRFLANFRKKGKLYERAGDGKWGKKAWRPSPETLAQWEWEYELRREAQRKAKS